MRGIILEYNSDTQSGLIEDEEGNCYPFDIHDCKSSIRPMIGAEVDFESDGDVATDIDVLSAYTDDYHPDAQKTSTASKMLIKLSLILGIGAFLAVMIYSEIERRHINETQKEYHAQLMKIKGYVNEGNCTEAASEYSRARETRKRVYELGLYYSIEPFAKQAHAIEIAECFAQSKDFINAVKILDAEEVHDSDYLRKASGIYENAGEKSKAQEAKSKADKYDLAK